MDYRLSPPTKGFQTFEIRRQYGAEDVDVLVNGNSFVMTHGELSGWLCDVGCHQPIKVVDLAWNYRRVCYDLTNQTLSIPNDQMQDATLRDTEALAAATLGKRISVDDFDPPSIFDDPRLDGPQRNTWFRS